MPLSYEHRASTLKALYDKIESICTRHIGVADYDCGDVAQFNEDYKYPLVYLETINFYAENERKNGESYSVALNVLDRQPEAGDRPGAVRTHDKVKQIFSEIKAYMEKRDQFGDANVSPATVAVFNDFDDAKLVRLRADFTLTVDMVVTPTADLDQIFPLL